MHTEKLSHPTMSDDAATSPLPLARLLPGACSHHNLRSQLSFPTPDNTADAPLCNTHPFVPALKSVDLDAGPKHPPNPDDAQPLRREYHPRNAQTAVVTMTSATIIATASPESVLPPLVSCSSRPILRTAGRR